MTNDKDDEIDWAVGRQAMPHYSLSSYKPFMGSMQPAAFGDFNSDKESFPHGRRFAEPAADTQPVSERRAP